jgi:hypothetical protein
VEVKVLTQHPEGKRGVRISKQKYDLIRDSVIEALQSRGDLTYTQLAEEVARRVAGRFDGNVRWYTECVKLDLEARAVITRVEGTRPQKLRLVG